MNNFFEDFLGTVVDFEFGVGYSISGPDINNVTTVKDADGNTVAIFPANADGSAVDMNTLKLSDIKSLNASLYNAAKAAIASESIVMQPSAAMAGVYAKVDSTSGVWKAPANVGLNSVVAPTVKISNEDQDGH